MRSLSILGLIVLAMVLASAISCSKLSNEESAVQGLESTTGNAESETLRSQVPLNVVYGPGDPYRCHCPGNSPRASSGKTHGSGNLPNSQNRHEGYGECPRSSAENIPDEITRNSKLWPLPNRDYESTRAIFESDISLSTVNRLAVAWRFRLPEVTNWGAAASNPLVMDGIVYFQDLPSNIFALDLSDGGLIWTRKGEGRSIAPNGLAVGYGKVFAAPSASGFFALDSSTGEVIWRADINLTDTEGIDIQPIVYDGLVYLSTAPRSKKGLYVGNGEGIIYALDESTGCIVWDFNTVDSEDIWGNREVNSGGGAWFPTSIDTARDITYWGIGNPGPWPGTEEYPNGSSRPGPNLYTDSILALDSKNGELLWYRQIRSHDLFDLDFHISPILVTADIQGTKRDVAIGAGKTGTVHAFDAESGHEFWVTNVGIHQNDHIEEIAEGEEIEVYPGSLGGVETFMSYADGTVYVPVINLPTFYTSSTKKMESLDGTGSVVAIDVDSGQINWETEFEEIVVGSTTVVNDLVFTSVFSGKVYAMNRSSGEVVWSFQAGAGINAPLAVAKNMLIVPAGMPLEEGRSPSIIALRLED